ncbi:MAG: hypothetical protein DDT19_02537 [Syntrophomonadaceae bacterium]|nr:hypothetical protein [Bacillota bacterium]
MEIPEDFLNSLNKALSKQNRSLTEVLTKALDRELKLTQSLDTKTIHSQVTAFATNYLESTTNSIISLPSLYEAFLFWARDQDQVKDQDHKTKPISRAQLARVLRELGFKTTTRSIQGRQTMVLTKAKFTHKAEEDKIAPAYEPL